ncbi:MAG: DUF503 domain-containing protein [Anaerolineales bacterium]|nr:DUF503 domain-containing protein [Anaerolineales bacterium]MCB0011730.1 DUF503 domain-containing protein [Anaerolineales bacterium]MCB8959609.1 DUF503 domain-containing protein [Ardenticatenales bacterium]
MAIVACNIHLQLTYVHSLKEKRRILKSIISRIGREFNVAIAEVDHHDIWQSATLGLVTVANDAAYAHGLLERVVAWIETNRPDIQLVTYQIENR